MSVSVLVAGCGDLGTEVGLRLAAAGARVFGLRRSPAVLPDAITGIGGDLAGALPALPGDVELVAYTAAASERTVAAYRTAYVKGLRRVLDGLAAAGASPRRVVFASSTAVYGVSDGSWVDEGTPTDPRTPTGQVLVEAERVLHDAGVGGVALRLAGIYGPGRTRLIDRVRDGTAVVPDPPVHTNRIHRDDAAAAIVDLLTTGDVVAPTYVGVDHAPVEHGEVLRFLADELGLPHPPTGAADRRRGGRRCRNDRLVAAGFSFTHPTYREGYRAVLAGHGTRHP